MAENANYIRLTEYRREVEATPCRCLFNRRVANLTYKVLAFQKLHLQIVPRLQKDNRSFSPTNDGNNAKQQQRTVRRVIWDKEAIPRKD
jgi:hypothetical protein